MIDGPPLMFRCVVRSLQKLWMNMRKCLSLKSAGTLTSCRVRRTDGRGGGLKGLWPGFLARLRGVIGHCLARSNG